MQRLIALGLATVILCSAIFLVHDHKKSPNQTHSETLPSVVPTLQGAAPIPTLAVGSTPQERTSSPTGNPSWKLLGELQRAKDWRAFALSAKSRPEEGGYFYAMYVTNLCGMKVATIQELARDAISTSIARTGTVSPTMIAMTETFMRRCASFAPNEAEEISQNLRTSASDQQDPITRPRQGLIAALKQKNRQSQRAALDALLALGDHLAIFKDQLLALVMSASPQAKQASALWFAGRLYGPDDTDSLSIMNLALTMASCVDGAPCELDNDMMLACLGGQFCVDDRQAHLRHRYLVEAGLSNEGFEQAVSLSQRIREAIDRRQVDAFIP